MEGDDGVVRARLRVRVTGSPPKSATLHIGASRAALAVREDDGALVVEGEARLPRVARWWPATHGPQPRHDARVVLGAGDDDVAIDLGLIAFRDLRARTDDGGFALVVNGVEIYARGACWMPLDVASLSAPDAAYARALDDARAAGMNTIRVPGVCPYEADAFYDACEARGLLVWQDLALASVDYPFDDAALAASNRARGARARK